MLGPLANRSLRISMLLPCAAQPPSHVSDGYGVFGSGASKRRLRTSPAASTSSRYVVAGCDVVTSIARPLYGRTSVQPRQPVEVSVVAGISASASVGSTIVSRMGVTEIISRASSPHEEPRGWQ